uniref:NADH-ubiquinone oxidoreductase chain 6 n=1 Tax=Bruchidius uberatus TaxID=298076 RepID=A0A6G8IZX5_9CUCU|nr:NADH dehydrogenase subunit 6 [Bruchidius uberatus]QIM59430.1 NADH dehydrogenase subunit 6 [Bruchidius uberatus]
MWLSLMFFMFSMPLMFMFLKHPLSMGLILLIQTIMTALMTGLMNLNFWFSYILFLIMIGGLLILFIYMTSIASNEKFKFSSSLFMLFFFNLMISLFLLLMDQWFPSLIFNSFDILKQNIYIYNYSFLLNKYFNYPNNMIVYMMIIYLLITLIMTVKITNISFGPMRQMP